jgi:2-C-methyl-D-erythritol 4-phosphate cytidylyltransferase / 2-C-methyl-D-erythritol 2,4-cyclodiphosphate synthase
MHVTAIIAAGGAGRRLGAELPKQMLDVGGRSLLQRSVDAFVRHPEIAEVIVALPLSLALDPPAWLAGVRVVEGGERRQDSVANACDALAAESEIVLIHDAARPFVTADVISRAIEGALRHGAAIVAVPVTDTVKRVRRREAQAESHELGEIVETLPREEIFLAQTPQAFRRQVLEAAVSAGRSAETATDEATLAERAGHRVHVVAGDASNIKITTASDLASAREKARPIRASTGRVGMGYDLHRLVAGRPLVLGGVSIASDRGAIGHSDADVICHAVTDAILGAARAGDIGQHFPDTDPKWKGSSSVALLREAVALVRGRGHAIENVDVVVVLEQPRVGPHRGAIEQRLAEALGVDPGRVSVKAKTNEGVDAVGRGEAIAAHAVALLTQDAGRPSSSDDRP